ncbi:MAG TPA: hypothetical protein VJU77_11820 [Chthoniobacterales bacterium]|nr:hypothetical protein [Chthoniobacterales bacterium]
MLQKTLSHYTLLFALLFGAGAELTAQPSRPEGSMLNPGPDLIVSDIGAPQQFGSNGTQVALAMPPTACNIGDVEVNFFQLGNTDHPVIAQSIYRMSGGASNTERFEQIGEAWIKHAFGADQIDGCDLGCVPASSFAKLGVGCSDTYDASTGAQFTQLGSRAWVNPFTGAFPSTSNDHSGHTHNGTSHRLAVEANDLKPSMNPGATYFSEVQYVTPHEYAWCQAHPGQCNMYNNASYCPFSVTGTTSFTFSNTGPTMKTMPAISAWTGATIKTIEPEPGVDGRAFIAYKVTGPVAGIWHYEYAIYNQNLDRAVQSFSIPLGCGVTLSNLGFHAPRNLAGFANDGTQGNAGYSNAEWTSTQTASSLSWTSETFAQNENANAIRWTTTYSFRFDSDRAPGAVNATIGFLKTGAPMTVGIQGPDVTCGGGTPTPTPVPGPASQALNLSTRMLVQAGDNAGIGGFIVTGSAPKHLLIRALGPSLTGFGISNALADTVLELHGPAGFVTITDDNWRDDPAQETAIMASGIAPSNNLESAIDVTVNPGSYTAVLTGKNNSSGVAVVEVYDLNQATSSKLANLSTRAFVSTGNDIVIAGFILGGNIGSDRIVARGIGPSLSGSGVPNPLANPMLELRDSNGALLAANNDWQDNAAQAAELTAAGLAPTNNLESGIATTLPPGAYTALLKGANNGTGIGLVEVYDRGAP